MWRRALAALVSIGLAVCLLWWVFHSVELPLLLAHLRHAQPVWVLAATALASLSLALRAWRWLAMLGSAREARFTLVLVGTAVGTLVNAIVPARSGDLIRVAHVSRHSRIRAPFLTGTIVVERVADTVALLALVAVGIIAAPEQARWATPWFVPLGVVVACALGALAVLPWSWDQLSPHWAQYGSRSSWGMKLSNLLEGGAEGLRVLHRPARLLHFVTFTIAIWAADVCGALAVALALHLDLPTPATCLLLGMLGLSGLLPIVPGSVGVFQFIAVAALTPFGLSSTAAVAFILMAQCLFLAVAAVWATAGLLTTSADGVGMPANQEKPGG